MDYKYLKTICLAVMLSLFMYGCAARRSDVSLTAISFVRGGDYMMEYRLVNNGDEVLTVPIGDLPWSVNASLIAGFAGKGSLLHYMNNSYPVADYGPQIISIAPGKQLCGLVNLDDIIRDMRHLSPGDEITIFWVYPLRFLDIKYGRQRVGGVLPLDERNHAQIFKSACVEWQNANSFPIKIKKDIK